MLCFLVEKLCPFISKIQKNRNSIFTKFTFGYYLMIINKLLSSFGTNPGEFKKVFNFKKFNHRVNVMFPRRKTKSIYK